MRLDNLAIARALRHVLGPAARIMLGGCATLTIVPAVRLEGQRLTPVAEPVAHIYAANWGVYLFKYLPLITGSLSRPGVPSWPTLFSDEVQVDLLVQKVSAESKRRGGTVLTDLRTRDRSYWLDWTLIFWLNEFEVTANSSRCSWLPRARLHPTRFYYQPDIKTAGGASKRATIPPRK